MEITGVFLVQKNPSNNRLRCMVHVKGQKQMEMVPPYRVPFHLLDRYYRRYPDTPLPSAQDLYGDTNPKLQTWMEEKNVGQQLPMNVRYVEMAPDKVYRMSASGVYEEEV